MPSTFVCRLAAQFPVPLLGGVRGGLVGARFMGRDGVRGPLAGSGAQCAHKVRRVWLKRESNEILPLPRGEGKENAALPTFNVRCSMFELRGFGAGKIPGTFRSRLSVPARCGSGDPRVGFSIAVGAAKRTEVRAPFWLRPCLAALSYVTSGTLRPKKQKAGNCFCEAVPGVDTPTDIYFLGQGELIAQTIEAKQRRSEQRNRRAAVRHRCRSKTDL